MTGTPLKRRIGLGLLAAYGVGVIVGAGIYVLVGLAIVTAGTVSAGAVLRGGVGYLTHAVAVDAKLAVLVLGGVLTAVAVLGVLESLTLAAVFTAIELAGLALVIWAGLGAAPTTDWSTPGAVSLGGVGLGAVLAFFAFIGFEDLVNMAEEVDRPEYAMPRAILISLVLTTVIYALVCLAAVRAVPVATLSASSSPLALVWQTARGGDTVFLSAIAVFAALNGVLAQIVMASRVLFGLGKRSPVLAVFHSASPRFGTSVLATLLVGAAVIGAALYVPFELLAELTSTILLGVFVLVNLALIVEKRRLPAAVFRVPLAVPAAGLGLSLAALSLAVGMRL